MSYLSHHKQSSYLLLLEMPAAGLPMQKLSLSEQHFSPGAWSSRPVALYTDMRHAAPNSG